MRAILQGLLTPLDDMLHEFLDLAALRGTMFGSGVERPRPVVATLLTWVLAPCVLATNYR